MDTYLFVTTPNQSGSTIIHNLLAKCRNCVPFECRVVDGHETYEEGHHYIRSCAPNTEKRNVVWTWTEIINEIQDKQSYNFELIKKLWNEQWRRDIRYDNNNRILLQKSPPHLGCIHLLEKNFDNVFFICQIRNPYIMAEGVRRRASIDIRRAGKHTIECIKLIYENLSKSKNILAWRYEDLFEIGNLIEKLIKDTIFGLDDFSLKKEISAQSIDGHLTRNLINLNYKQLKNLSEKDIRILNEVFEPYFNLIYFFGYERLV